jgi:hypothetical protein
MGLKLFLSNTASNGSIAGGAHNTDGMDETVVTGNVNGEVRKCSESLLSENGVVYEIFTELARVGEGLALDCGERSTGNPSSGDSSSDDAVVENVGADRSIQELESLDGSVSWGKDSEGSSSLKCCGNTRGCETSRKELEVVVSLEVRLTHTSVNTIGSPDLSGTLERGKSVNDVGVQGSVAGEC